MIKHSGAFAVGVMFTILGATTNAGFFGAGIPFLVIGVIGLARPSSKGSEVAAAPGQPPPDPGPSA